VWRASLDLATSRICLPAGVDVLRHMIRDKGRSTTSFELWRCSKRGETSSSSNNSLGELRAFYNRPGPAWLDSTLLARETVLAQGDRVCLGDNSLQFLSNPEAAQRSQAWGRSTCEITDRAAQLWPAYAGRWDPIPLLCSVLPIISALGSHNQMEIQVDESVADRADAGPGRCDPPHLGPNSRARPLGSVAGRQERPIFWAQLATLWTTSQHAQDHQVLPARTGISPRPR